MNKTELVELMADKSGLSKKDADAALKAFMEVTKDAVSHGDKVQLIGFATFFRKDTAEREGRNPSTGESMKIAAKKKFAMKSSITF